jgi:hypothetical protein
MHHGANVCTITIANGRTPDRQKSDLSWQGAILATQLQNALKAGLFLTDPAPGRAYPLIPGRLCRRAEEAWPDQCSHTTGQCTE